MEPARTYAYPIRVKAENKPRADKPSLWVARYHEPYFLLRELRQLRDVGHDPPRLIAREQLGRRLPARFILEIKVSQFLRGARLLCRERQRDAVRHWNFT